GASLYFDGGRQVSEFGGTCLSEDLPMLLGLAAEALTRPTFPVEQLERVRGERLTGLQIRANDTRAVAARTFREMLYPEGHPYSIAVGGYEATLPAISRDDLIAFHRDYYGPRDAIITVVGAVTAEQARELVEAAFGGWQNPGQLALPVAADVDRPVQIKRRYMPLADKTQTDIILGWTGPRRNEPDYMEASLANTILGVFGMMGRLGKSVREEQGLAYYASSRLQSGLGPSSWQVSTGVAPDKAEQAITSIRAEIRRMQDEPVTEEELADCQAYRTGSLPVSLETNDGLSDIIMNIEYLGLGDDYLQRFPAIINSVTVADIQRVAQTWLDPDAFILALAGPPEGEG
ncbi:MAG: insulinase family protein, partial [Anaerolineales bacterium]|nr:insulinase family protein [Anaerolineales bacterium]